MAIAPKPNVSAPGSWLRTAIQNRRNRRRSMSLQKQSILQKILTKSGPTPGKTPAIYASESVEDGIKRRKVSTQGVRVPPSLEKRRLQDAPAYKVKLSSQHTEMPSVGHNGVDNLPRKVFAATEDSSPIPVMPNSGSLPSWLLRLYTIHRYSSVVAFLFVAVTLVIYGWTVYSQQLWSQAYRHLQNLQHHERQLTTINGILKEKMAQAAQQPTAGLAAPTPKGSIFLNPAPVDSNLDSPTTTQNSESQQQTTNPVGY
jgi:hypothetical protein